MAKMRAAEAAVHVLPKEGVNHAFGLPGAAINPFYAAMRTLGGISHVLARHVEGASHMPEGYTRARAGLIEPRAAARHGTIRRWCARWSCWPITRSERRTLQSSISARKPTIPRGP